MVRVIKWAWQYREGILVFLKRLKTKGKKEVIAFRKHALRFVVKFVQGHVDNSNERYSKVIQSNNDSLNLITQDIC